MDERRTAGRTAAVLWAISAAGLLLAVSIAPGAINMCIGVAVPATIATAMYVGDARRWT